MVSEHAGPEAVERYIAALGTDIGYSHQVNQDAGTAWASQRSDGTPVGLAVVADGVSAGRRSEDASRLVVDEVRQEVLPLLTDGAVSIAGVVNGLVGATRRANHLVSQRQPQTPGTADATTVVAAVCVGRESGGAWCGDSRVYALGGTVRRLTRDHSWAESAVSGGLLSAEEAARDPRAHMITRWLGPPQQDDPGIEMFSLRLEPGDTILCCSDGLYMYFAPPDFAEEEMRLVLERHGDHLQSAVDELVQTALARGGQDNVTAAALRLTSGTEAPGSSDEHGFAGLRLPRFLRGS